jgi:hypothetical protein
MQRTIVGLVFMFVMAFCAVSPASAGDIAMSASLRAGIPTAVLANIGSLYTFGLGLEASLGVQVLDWQFLSLAVSTGSVSVGVNLGF